MPALLSEQEHLARLLSTPRPGEENILAFYEHRLGGISKSPRLMLLPLDDHVAHRGDGVFETIRCAGGKLYRFDLHMARMEKSAAGIRLAPPVSWEELKALVPVVVAAGGEKECMVRVLLGRGPGGFGISPAECPEASLYIAVYRFTRPSDAWYAAGLSGFRTSVPAKQGYLARIKNANYLPNVLMMLEAADKGAEVPFCYDADGSLTESAVAGLCLVNAQGVLEIPESVNVLSSTTVGRAVQLLNGEIPHVSRRLTEEDVFAAKEVLLLGTGPDCAAVVRYEGRDIGDGKEGPVAKRLRALIRKDMEETGTPVPGL